MPATATKKAKKTVVEEPAAEALTDDLLDDVQTLPDVATIVSDATGGIEVATSGEPEELVPLPHSIEWTPFILGKLHSDEIYDGCPTVEGLRRVAREYLGDIVESVSEVPQPPNVNNGNHACVVHHLVIEGPDGKNRRYSGVADVFSGNGGDKDGAFSWRFAAATCETRAESRAYRRALQLRHVVTVEEMTEVPAGDSGASGTISKPQRSIINVLCARCDIDPMKFIQDFKKKHQIRDSWGAVKNIPHVQAVRMLADLSEYQRLPNSVPQEIKGYSEEWLNN